MTPYLRYWHGGAHSGATRPAVWLQDLHSLLEVTKHSRWGKRLWVKGCEKERCVDERQPESLENRNLKALEEVFQRGSSCPAWRLRCELRSVTQPTLSSQTDSPNTAPGGRGRVCTGEKWAAEYHDSFSSTRHRLQIFPELFPSTSGTPSSWVTCHFTSCWVPATALGGGLGVLGLTLKAEGKLKPERLCYEL